MEKRARQRLTKELGLEAGYRALKFVTGSEYLHYGRFEADIPRDFIHMKAAQDRYLERLIELIPAGVRRILDVGAGTGKTADVLINRGYAVDCVAPGSVLAGVVEARLASRGVVYCSRFEDAVIPARYDLILFSESFQYIPMATAIEKAIALLNPGGHILIADFFNLKPEKSRAFGGGHKFRAWLELYPRYPLELLAEQDITAETAVLHDLVHQANNEVFIPLMATGRTLAVAHWPILSRILLFFFGRRVEKLVQKRTTGDRTGAEFIRAKVYKVYLFRLTASAPAAAL